MEIFIFENNSGITGFSHTYIYSYGISIVLLRQLKTERKLQLRQRPISSDHVYSWQVSDNDWKFSVVTPDQDESGDRNWWTIVISSITWIITNARSSSTVPLPPITPPPPRRPMVFLWYAGNPNKLFPFFCDSHAREYYGCADSCRTNRPKGAKQLCTVCYFAYFLFLQRHIS